MIGVVTPIYLPLRENHAVDRKNAGRMSRSEQEVLQFIAASFPSVWALELMLVLRRDRRAWDRQELVAALRASELVINKALDALLAAGIASLDDDRVLFLPVNSDVDACLERVEQLYRSRPNRVRREIVAASTSSATAFADAFKIRREKDG